jgi:hypothetical protein
MHTNTLSCMHTYVYTVICIDMYRKQRRVLRSLNTDKGKDKKTYTYIHGHAHTRIHIHQFMQGVEQLAYRHLHQHIYLYIYIYIYIYTCTHTHIHANIHTYILNIHICSIQGCRQRTTHCSQCWRCHHTANSGDCMCLHWECHYTGNSIDCMCWRCHYTVNSADCILACIVYILCICLWWACMCALRAFYYGQCSALQPMLEMSLHCEFK